MERRKSILAATAVAGTFLVGAAALTANAGLLGAAGADPVGRISPVSASPTTIYVPVGPDTSAAAPVVVTPSASTAATHDGEHDHEGDEAGHEEGERDD